MGIVLVMVIGAVVLGTMALQAVVLVVDALAKRSPSA